VGAGLLIGALNTSTEIRSMERPGSQQQILLNQYNSLSTGAYVCFSVAGIALITSVILFFVEGR